MIKDIFVPENIGSYYLFEKRIVGFDIGRTSIYATISVAKGNKRTIEKFIEERIDIDSDKSLSNLSYEERIIQALKNITPKLGKYDAIYASFDSSLVVFKELSLPFSGVKKVKMVIPFEVESLLPFTLDHAVIDSITTKENKTDNSTDVLVAAVKREYIEQFVDIFHAAGLTIDKITIDMFELYSLFLSIPAYQHFNETIALINLGTYSTRIAIISERQLKYIRVLSKGIINVAKKIKDINNLEVQSSLDKLMRFGIDGTEDNEYAKSSKEILGDLLHEVQFTISSYINKAKNIDQLRHIIITGSGADIPGICNLAENVIATQCQILQAKKIIHNGTIHSKIKTIPNNFLISLATSLSLPSTQEFNLQQVVASQKEDSILNTQLIIFGSLLFLILSVFSVYSYLSIRNLRSSVLAAETSATQELKRTFKLKESQVRTLDSANKAALNELKKQETAWDQLSTDNRYSLLRYLSELSKCINLKDTQLNLSSIIFKGDLIKIYGQVPDFNQLNKLQYQLSGCPIFKKLDKLQDPDFRSDPIILTINKDQEI